jgi:hypothetical protein
MFLKLKMKLKVLHFADVAEIQEAGTEDPKSGIFGSFSETVRPRKGLFVCLWSLF